MKRIVLMLLLAGAILFAVFFPSEGLQELGQKIRQLVHEISYEREVSISGQELTAGIDLLTDALRSRSNLWWLISKSKIEAEMMHSPFVKQASVSTCGGYTWGCFEVVVTERQPLLLAAVGSKTWVIAGDGAFMTPLDELFALVRTNNTPELKRKLVQISKLPLIEGLVDAGGSTSISRSRFHYTNQALTIIQAESGMKIERLAIHKNGELSVKFRSLGFLVVFGYEESERSNLKEEAQRLKLLIGELALRLDEIRKVDLAFKKMAVISFGDNSVENR